MATMTTMTLISIILAVLGMGTAIYTTKKLPDSISAMVYSLVKPWQWLWSAWVVARIATIGKYLTQVSIQN